MENKLYQSCREEARKQITKLNQISGTTEEVNRLYREQLSQLTAEIYGMRLLDMVAVRFVPNVAKKLVLNWQKDNYQNKEKLYPTQDLHDHFVREFNEEEGKSFCECGSQKDNDSKYCTSCNKFESI